LELAEVLLICALFNGFLALYLAVRVIVLEQKIRRLTERPLTNNQWRTPPPSIVESADISVEQLPNQDGGETQASNRIAMYEWGKREPVRWIEL
jgi:hypothetical protein